MTQIKTDETAAADPCAAAREALRIAQAAYRKAAAKHGKLMEVADAAEKRLATTINDLREYEHLEDDVALASCKLLIKGGGGGELQLPETSLKQIAARDALSNDRKILEQGLVSLHATVRDSYAHKKTAYTALDDAGAAILRAESDVIALRCASLLEELRAFGSRLKALQNAGGFPREKPDFYIGMRPCTSGYANQVMAQIETPPRLEGNGAATKRLVEWHEALLGDANTTPKEE